MTVTTQSSIQAGYQADPSLGKLQPADMGPLRLAYFSHTQDGAGDANSTVDLIRMPAGRVRVIGHLSKVDFSAFGSGRTLDIGYTAYVEPDGDAVVLDVDQFLDGANVASAGTAALVGYHVIESAAGFIIQAKVLGDTIPTAATLQGVVAYMVG